MKKLYALQPYMVGSKKGKSLVVVIPSEVVKTCNIDTSTVFTLRGDQKYKNSNFTDSKKIRGKHNICAIWPNFRGSVPEVNWSVTSWEIKV